MKSKKNFGISDKVMNLWYAVNRKYGQHTYVIGVTGQGKLVLSKGYDLARGSPPGCSSARPVPGWSAAQRHIIHAAGLSHQHT